MVSRGYGWDNTKIIQNYNYLLWTSNQAEKKFLLLLIHQIISPHAGATH